MLISISLENMINFDNFYFDRDLYAPLDSCFTADMQNFVIVLHIRLQRLTLFGRFFVR